MKNGPVIKIGPGEEFPENTPKQYIQGWIEFYKLKFKVSPDVLIPRPETELLVDEVLAFIGSDPVAGMGNESPRTKKGPTLTVLDVGTGAGNIAIAIAKNAPNVRIFATDVSPAALEVAKENARLNKVEDRIFFILSNLLESIRDSSLITNHSLLIIVANLPYIPTSRIPYLDPSVKDFEPRVALDGGPDGFELYRKLFGQIRHRFLSVSRGVNIDPPPRWKRKLIICEIDYTHGELAIQEAQKYFPEAKVEVKTDLAQKQRILMITFR